MSRRLYAPTPIRSAFNLGDVLIKLAIGAFGLGVGIAAAVAVRGEFITAANSFAALLKAGVPQ